MAFVCMNNMIDKTLWLFSTIFYILHLVHTPGANRLCCHTKFSPDYVTSVNGYLISDEYMKIFNFIGRASTHSETF